MQVTLSRIGLKPGAHSAIDSMMKFCATEKIFFALSLPEFD
jgi:hypothetical protein